MKPPFKTVLFFASLAWISALTFLYYGATRAHLHGLLMFAVPNLILAALLTALVVRSRKG